MNDLISRKDLGAAIDNWLAIDRYYHPYSKQKTIPVSELVDIIKLLPSAQTDVPDGNVGDMISRQDVLALAKDVILINGAKHRCIDATQIHELPSAQPEQTKMIKEIREWINSGNRGSADYFIVDKIEEIINKYE